MKNTLLFLFFLVFCLSCKTPEKVENSNKPVVSIEKKTTANPSTNLGLSFEKAVIINKTNEMEGIQAEYDWLKKNYPGYKNLGQSTVHQKDKSYDLLKIKTANGEVKTIYFDISKFFGKF